MVCEVIKIRKIFKHLNNAKQIKEKKREHLFTCNKALCDSFIYHAKDNLEVETELLLKTRNERLPCNMIHVDFLGDITHFIQALSP